MTDFFISYTGIDVAWARWIAGVLESNGYSCVYQERDFPIGSPFLTKMHEAATECDRTIAILSEEYLKSAYCEKEWQAAYNKRGKKDTTALFPVRVRKCEPGGLLNQIARIDLVESPGESASEQLLLNGLQPTSAPPGTRHPYPPAKPNPAPGITPARYPGDKPPHWNLAHVRNKYFTGRDTLLEQVSAILNSGQNVTLSQPAAITGLGGIGKTSTAVEFCYRNVDRYEVIWWIRSETSDTLQADYAALAEELNLQGRAENDVAVNVRLVRHWLETHGGWLLVFDNAETADALKDYIPQFRKGHILITSRAQNWDEVAESVGVEKLDTETAVAFLLTRTKQTDATTARNIAIELDGLPLALEQAASYISVNRGMMLAEWLGLYHSERLRLLDEVKPPVGHPESVTVTWNMAFQQIRKTPFAAIILNTIAFFAPDNIPNDLLLPCIESCDALDLNRALFALMQHSLIERGKGGVSVHRLVQAVTREQMSAEEHVQALQQALIIALNACPEGDTQTNIAGWPVYARLLPHLRAAAEHADQIGVQNETLADLWRRIGLYCKNCLGDYSATRHAFGRSLAIAEVLRDAGHRRVGLAYNNLGNALRRLGDYQGAKQAYERALSIQEAAYSKDHPSVARTVNNLGNALRRLGDYQGAKQAYERAISIKEAAYGKDHPQVAITVTNLGNVLRNQGDYQGAKQAYERAISIKEAAYGKDHPSVARTVNNLGLVLKYLGDYQGARQAYERALAVKMQFLGPEHPETRRTKDNLAELEAEQARPKTRKRAKKG